MPDPQVEILYFDQLYISQVHVAELKNVLRVSALFLLFIPLSVLLSVNRGNHSQSVSQICVESSEPLGPTGRQKAT